MEAIEVDVEDVRVKVAAPAPVRRAVPDKAAQKKMSAEDRLKEMKRMIQREEFLAVVKKYDDDGSGQLSITEIEPLVEELLNGGEKIDYKDDDKADQIMKIYDLDGNGEFEYSEVKAIINDLEEQKKVAGALVKLIFVFALAIFGLMGALMGVVMAANEGSKESHTDPDASAMTQLSGEAMQVDGVKAYAGLFDLPLVDTDELMKTQKLSLYIDFTEREDIEVDWVAAFFKVAGMYSGSGISIFVTTYEGYTLFLDNEAQKGTITMLGKTYPIAEAPPANATRRMLDDHAWAWSQSGYGPNDRLLMTRKEWRRYEQEFNELNHPVVLERGRRMLQSDTRGRMMFPSLSKISIAQAFMGAIGPPKPKKKKKKKKKKEKASGEQDDDEDS